LLSQRCSKCREDKLYEGFVFDKRYNRPKKKCKSCEAITYKAWARDNRQKLLDRNKKYRADNPDFCKLMANKNMGNQKLYQTSRNSLAAKRRGNKLHATPKWLSKDQLIKMGDLYWLCKDLLLISGQEYHVDHIVPLKGKNVCGLHVPWNLQILPSDVNIRKSNKY
jgi:hypothetical protein